MSHEYLNKVRRVLSGAVDLNAVADTVIAVTAVPTVVPSDAYRFYLVPNANLDVVTDNFVIALDWRPTPGSDTGRFEIARITATPTQDLTLGQVYYADAIINVAAAAGEDALEPSFPDMPRSTVNVDPIGPGLLNPGGQFVVEVINAAGNAGTGTVVVEVVEHNGVGARFNATAFNRTTVT